MMSLTVDCPLICSIRLVDSKEEDTSMARSLRGRPMLALVGPDLHAQICQWAVLGLDFKGLDFEQAH